jgi:hypothetical protein
MSAAKTLARAPLAAPVIGDVWPGQGGIYAGSYRDKDGSIYHGILATVEPDASLDHDAAMQWAAALEIDGHKDFTLPDRTSGLLLQVNLSHLIKPTWHWLAPQSSRNGAWYQYFDDGNQGYGDKSAKLRARAFRRFVP